MNMRKFLITAILIMILIVPININAMKAVGNVEVVNLKPIIDGKIDLAGEWAEANMFKFNSDTAKAWSGEMTKDFNADVYTLWDNAGFYVAGIITDSTYTVSPDGGYGGDGFQISIDLGQVFNGTTNNRAIFYSFGCYDGKALVQVQEAINNRIVYDGDEGFAIKTAKTSTGWEFEVMFPWDSLHKDMKDKMSKDVKIEIGTKLNALFCYIDKDGDTMLAACGTTLNDESLAFDWTPLEHGVTFVLAEYVPPVIEVIEEAPVTQTTTAPITATSSPQTADAVGIAIVMAIMSGAGLIIKKRK